MVDFIQARSDEKGKAYWIPPVAIATIAINTAFDADSYVAFSPATDVNVYFGTATTVTYPVTAGSIFMLPRDQDAKLDAETVCLLF